MWHRNRAPRVVLDPQYYQLNFGTSDNPFAGGEANNIDQCIVFIDNIGFVTPGTIPDYDGLNHTYHFVFHVQTTIPSLLSFGVLDGIYYDNGGAFEITVFPVVAIPEPASWCLAIGGLMAISALRLTRP